MGALLRRLHLPGRQGAVIRELFTDARYVAFWLSQVGSHLGNGLTLVALASQVIPTRGAATYGLVLAVNAGAMSLMMLFGGVAADRYSRTRVMLAGDLACVLGVVGYLSFGHDGPVAGLLVAAALIGLGTGIYAPAHRAALPQLVPEHLRQQANAVESGTKRLAGAAGAALGGLLVAVGNVQVAYVVDVATFVVSAVALAWIALPPVSGRGEPGADGARFWGDVRGGVEEVIRRPWAAAVMVQGTLQMFVVYGPQAALVPVVAEQRYAAGAFGILSASQFVGAMAGSVLAARIRPRRAGITAMHGLAPSAALALCLGFPVPLWLFATLGALAWAGLSVFVVLWYTALQNEIPTERQGRVFALDSIAAFGLQPFALALAPLLASAIGYEALAVIGAATLLLSSYGLLVVPGVPRLRSDAAPRPPAPASPET